MSVHPNSSCATQPKWFKSSYSSGEGGNCVEVAACPHTIHVRDSKDTDGPELTLTPAAWTTFLSHTTCG